MKERAVGYVAALMVKSFGVSDFVYSLLIISFPSFATIFLGPIISVKSDRHRGRFGRRIPFLLFITPIAAAGMLGLAATPYVAKWVHYFCNTRLSFTGIPFGPQIDAILEKLEIRI